MGKVKINNKKIIFCITGWYLKKSFYKDILKVGNKDVFIVVHRSPKKTPKWLFKYFKRDNILFEPNLGYDWGCYQQFLNKKIWEKYDFIFFLHDDILIKDLGFVNECIKLLISGKKVIGNGINSKKTDWPKTHYALYSHSKWKPPSFNYKHKTIRGSFLVTTKKVLMKLKNLEVFWDWLHISIRYGNRSLLSTCGEINDLFGSNSFGYLSNKGLNSKYIKEHVRSGCDRIITDKPKDTLRYMLKVINRKIGTKYMYLYLNSKSKFNKKLLYYIFNPVISLISGSAILGIYRRLYFLYYKKYL